MAEKIALLDLGTNTFHLLLAEVENGDYTVLMNEKTAVKIGKEGIVKGVITEAAQERAVEAIRKYAKTIEEHNATVVFATATSAIRNAKNGSELIDKIYRASGIIVRVISGDEEAQFIYHGIKTALDIGNETSVIMDIGGGSVEFIICNSEKIFWKQSFEIGAQRLLDLFHYHDPITSEEIEKLNEYLEDKLSPLKSAINDLKPNVLIGASGSFDTVAEIHCSGNGTRFHGEMKELTLSQDEYLTVHNEIIQNDKQRRLSIPGMIEMRVDMIVVACCLIRFVLGIQDPDKIRISTASLKEGLLVSALKSI